MSKWSDTRVAHFTEALNGIRVIKMLSWEATVEEKVSAARDEEYGHLRTILGLKMYNMLLVFLVPSVTAAIIFSVYVALDNELTVTTVFTIFAYLSVIRPPMSAIPRVVAGVAEGLASCRRIEAFFALDEKEPVTATAQGTEPSVYPSRPGPNATESSPPAASPELIEMKEIDARPAGKGDGPVNPDPGSNFRSWESGILSSGGSPLGCCGAARRVSANGVNVSSRRIARRGAQESRGKPGN